MEKEMRDYGMGHCPICGAFFSKTSRAHKYCSPVCAQKNADRRRHERYKLERAELRKDLTCEVCGAPLTGRQTKYCCKECSSKSRNVEPTEDRCECKRKETCIYGAKLSGVYCCDFIGITGKSRGGYPDECTYYEKKKRRGPKQAGWSATRNWQEEKK